MIITRILQAFILGLVVLVSTASATDVKMGEEWDYRIRGSKITFVGGDLYNYSYYGSGDLQISLWALSSPYRGKKMRGYRLGYVNVAPLGARRMILNFVRKTTYKRPPRGRWYLSYILCEWDEGGCYARSWLNWGSKKKF